MDFLLILTYAGLCIAIFKIFKIRVTGVSLLTAVLGGVGIIGFLLLAMNYNHPFSKDARFYYNTIPIVPVVGGKVIEAPLKGSAKVKRGDVLFRLDPTRYQAVVEQKKAALAEAAQAEKQLTAARTTAEARLASAKADAERAREAFERVEAIGKSGSGGAVSQQEIDTKRGLFLAAQATAEAATSELTRARLAETSQIDGVNTTVARLQGELAAAQFDLEQTTVLAPSDGSVEQTFLREGMMAVPLPLRPVMVFLPDEPPMFAAGFLQNSAQRLEAGNKAEVSFPAVPGRVFKAKIVRIQPAIAQGQVQATGALIDPEQIRNSGRVMAVLAFEEDLKPYQLVPGTTGVVAVYSEHMHHISIMRKVLLRMGAWKNFLFSDGH
jgi:multidrug resistance efflux pump